MNESNPKPSISDASHKGRWLHRHGATVFGVGVFVVLAMLTVIMALVR